MSDGDLSSDMPSADGSESDNQDQYLVQDMDNDGDVDYDDYTSFKNYYGTTESIADFNSDGFVNAIDLSMMNKAYCEDVNLDLNADGNVDDDDLVLFNAVFRTDDECADFNKDGTVNTLDLNIFKEEYVASTP